MRCSKVGAARVGDGRNADTPLLERERGHALEPLDASHAERFGIRHDMGLRHRHEIARTEITTDLDLMLDRPPRGWAELTGSEGFFFLGQFHLSAEGLALKNPAADVQH